MPPVVNQIRLSDLLAARNPSAILGFALTARRPCQDCLDGTCPARLNAQPGRRVAA